MAMSRHQWVSALRCGNGHGCTDLCGAGVRDAAVESGQGPALTIQQTFSRRTCRGSVCPPASSGTLPCSACSVLWRQICSRGFGISASVLFALVALFAVGTELLQIPIAGRTASVRDLLYDLGGFSAGYLLLRLSLSRLA